MCVQNILKWSEYILTATSYSIVRKRLMFGHLQCKNEWVSWC